MKTSSRKAKGRRLQQWVRDYILFLYSDMLDADDVRSTPMGVTGEDIQLSPHARCHLMQIQIECKNHKKITNIWDHYKQAKQHGNYEPVLVIKENREKPLVVVDAKFFFHLLNGII